MVSQMSESSSLSVSITTWSSAHDVRFWRAMAISRTRSPSIIGRKLRVSHGHRCSIRSSTSACGGSVTSSLKCVCAQCQCVLADDPLSPSFPFHQPFPRSELWFAVVDLSNVMTLPTVSLLCTEGSLDSVSSLVVLCAVERVFRFTRSFSRPRSRHSLRISIIVSSCESRYDFCFYRAPFHCRMCNCIRGCSQKWNLFLQCRINSWGVHRTDHWMRKACSHFVIRFVHSISLLGSRLPPNRPSVELASTIDAVLPDVFPNPQARQQWSFPHHQCFSVPILCEVAAFFLVTFHM